MKERANHIRLAYKRQMNNLNPLERVILIGLFPIPGASVVYVVYFGIRYVWMKSRAAQQSRLP